MNCSGLAFRVLVLLCFVLKAISIGLSLCVTGRVELRRLCTHGGEEPSSASERASGSILAQAHAEAERLAAERLGREAERLAADRRGVSNGTKRHEIHD